MRITTNNTLNRRTLLRGMGAALALPLLDSMTPARAAGAKPIIRLGFVYTPNGMIPAGWLPKTEGAAYEITPTMRSCNPRRSGRRQTPRKIAALVTSDAAGSPRYRARTSFI